MKRRTCRILVAAVLTLSTAPAFAGGATFCVNCSSWMEQLVEEGTFIEQLAKQAEQLRAQIETVYNQVRNLQGLPFDLWSSVQGDVQQLIQIAAQAQGVGYASQNVVGAFQQTYGANAAQIPPHYLQTLQQWTTDTNSQVQAALEQYHLDAGQFGSTQGALQGVEDASQSAAGRMQVLQAANQISGLEVNQLQQLRQETMAGNSAMLSYVAKQNNAQQQHQNLEQQWLDSDGQARPFM
ncbi:MAG: P-type conjugative transfer protein TrbJ [Acidiferrobacterales bacterium]